MHPIWNLSNIHQCVMDAGHTSQLYSYKKSNTSEIKAPGHIKSPNSHASTY